MTQDVSLCLCVNPHTKLLVRVETNTKEDPVQDWPY